MKKTQFLLFFFLSVVRPWEAAAQVDASDSLLLFGTHQAVESVHLHCDKYLVQSGDTIWWKAYLFDGLLPSRLSTNLYVELFSPTGRLLQQGLFPVDSSVSIGQVGISDTLASGVYWLRAYTRYQLRVDSTHLFSTPITVLNEKSLEKAAIAEPMDPRQAPFVIHREGLLVVATPTDSGVNCHIEADSVCPYIGQPLDLVLAHFHVPSVRATFSLNRERYWQDLLLKDTGLVGPGDLLLFSGGHLICRDSLFLGVLPSAEVSIQEDTLNVQPGGYNVWSVRIAGVTPYNCSISVTDAGRSISNPTSIVGGPAADPLPYDAVGKSGLGLPSADTSYLTWTGRVLSEKGTTIKGGELVLLAHNASLKRAKPLLVSIDDNGRFSIRGGFFFDSLSVSYQLNSYQDDPSAKGVHLVLDGFRIPDFVKPVTLFRLETDAEISTQLKEIQHMELPAGTRVKELPQVIVTGNVLKELDKRYASGMFSEPAPYLLDVRTDKSVHTIWAYLRKNLPGFMGGADLGMAPTFNDKSVVFFVDDQLQSLSDMEDYWYEEIAFVKAYPSLWVDETPFTKWKTGFAGFSLSGGSGGLKTPNGSDPPVVCLYTRKGDDIRTGWRGLSTMKFPGYSAIRSWTRSSQNNPCLYWQPLEARNQFKIRFYNGSANRYRICIEGLSPEGKVVHCEEVISVPGEPATASRQR